MERGDGNRSDEGDGRPDDGVVEPDQGQGRSEAGTARRAVHAMVAAAVTVLAVAASALLGLPGLLLGPDTAVGFALGALGGELAFVLVGLGFLVVTGRGVGYLDLALPGSARDWGLVVGLTVGLFVVRTVLVVGALELGVQPAPSNVAQVELSPATLTAILLPMMLLVVGPAEELLFRGVLQKFLRETTGPRGAILGAGLLFGGIHVFSLVLSTSLGTVLSLVVITGVGFCLGWLYEHTGSLPAAMLAHGGYNALIVASAYVLETLA